MSAANGGRGTPPVPPEGHGPPAPAEQEIPILKEVTWTSLSTDAERAGDDAVILSFVVAEGGQQVRHNYLAGGPGKQAILDALTGGLALP